MSTDAQTRGGARSTAPLILASSSKYRVELLRRYGLPFATEAPGVDEARRPGEPPHALVQRLALEKARAVAARHPDAVVIGSDQLVEAHGEVLGKPGTAARAVAQLEALAGATVTFLTAVAVAARGEVALEVVPTEVKFRALARDALARYVAREAPLDCAGSFKSEALGIALFERMTSDDPTALIGLPLIATARLLRQFGIDPLA